MCRANRCRSGLAQMITRGMPPRVCRPSRFALGICSRPRISGAFSLDRPLPVLRALRCGPHGVSMRGDGQGAWSQRCPLQRATTVGPPSCREALEHAERRTPVGRVTNWLFGRLNLCLGDWSWTLTRSTFTALSHAGPLCVFRRERSCRRAAVRFGVAWPGGSLADEKGNRRL